MKRISIVFVATAFLLLKLTTLKAQTIVSYTLIPSAPTVNDAIYLDLSTEFSYGDCDLVFSNVSFSGNTITLTAYYRMGMLTYICDRTDRFWLGSNLSCGQYVLNINTYLWNSSFNYSDNASTSFNVGCSSAALNLKFYIEGYYSANELMRPVMANQNVPGATALQTDTAVVELHDRTDPAVIISSFKGVVNKDGTMSCTFPASVIGDSCYIVVSHRNAIKTWSAAPVFLSGTTDYDFTPAKKRAYGENMSSLDGVWAFYSGDINQDSNIDLVDFPELDVGIVNGFWGYYSTDLNGDGNVDLIDFPALNKNIVKGIFSKQP